MLDISVECLGDFRLTWVGLSAESTSDSCSFLTKFDLLDFLTVDVLAAALLDWFALILANAVGSGWYLLLLLGSAPVKSEDMEDESLWPKS